MLLASGTALAQADAGGQINDGAFPPGFDCSKLETPKTQLECQTFQAHRTPDRDAVPPGTPAIPMPGESNSISGPYIGPDQDLAPNRDSQDVLHGRRTSH
jgi:hypothetical protein